MGIDTKTVYSQKAERYARYRWDYAPMAVETIFNLAQLNEHSSVADIGAGTGIFTRHFTGRVGQVFAVEPNAEMRAMAEKELAGCAACQVIAATSDATTLPDHSVDLITVAQALHWFDPEPTRVEFRRVIKPGGWLAVINNASRMEELGRASAELYTPAFGFENLVGQQRPVWKPLIYYFGNGRFQRIRFPFSFQENWEQFWGALLFTAGMPDESHPRFNHLEQAAHRLFEQFSKDGLMEVNGVTELYIGQISV